MGTDSPLAWYNEGSMAKACSPLESGPETQHLSPDFCPGLAIVYRVTIPLVTGGVSPLSWDPGGRYGSSFKNDSLPSAPHPCYLLKGQELARHGTLRKQAEEGGRERGEERETMVLTFVCARLLLPTPSGAAHGLRALSRPVWKF